jgi:hypothetical protein
MKTILWVGVTLFLGVIVASQWGPPSTPTPHDSTCDSLYREWDQASKLHKGYGDHAATQADVDLAKGLFYDCAQRH